MTTVPLKQIQAAGALQLVRVNSGGTAAEVAPGITAAAGGALQTTGVGNGSVSGSARGTGAVDLQTNRSGNSQVASGAYAFAMGQNNTAAGAAAAALGDSNSANSNYSFATGAFAVAARTGQHTHSSGASAFPGEAQTSVLVLRVTTSNATLTEMTLPTRITLQNDSTIAFELIIAARRTDVDNESAGWIATGVIDRNTNAASTALVGMVIPTLLARDSMAWSITVDADTTNGALRIQVQGEAGKAIRWVAFCRLVEVSG
jgi:hypothetical protein